jgi:DNA-binding response OmpR family regulator
MQRQVLEGYSILVVECEPLTVAEITNAFEATGAALTITNTFSHAFVLAAHDRLSAVILGRAVIDTDRSLLTKRLKARGIPFLIYSESDTVESCEDALRISKPAADGVLVAAIERLIRVAPFCPTDLRDLLVQQRQVGDEYRAVQKVVEELHKLMGSKIMDPSDRSAMEVDVAVRTAALNRLGKRLLQLDAAVTVASLRSEGGRAL